MCRFLFCPDLTDFSLFANLLDLFFQMRVEFGFSGRGSLAGIAHKTLEGIRCVVEGADGAVPRPFIGFGPFLPTAFSSSRPAVASATGHSLQEGRISKPVLSSKRSRPRTRAVDAMRSWKHDYLSVLSSHITFISKDILCLRPRRNQRPHHKKCSP